jgi:hypothetical protein
LFSSCPLWGTNGPRDVHRQSFSLIVLMMELNNTWSTNPSSQSDRDRWVREVRRSAGAVCSAGSPLPLRNQKKKSKIINHWGGYSNKLNVLILTDPSDAPVFHVRDPCW